MTIRRKAGGGNPIGMRRQLDWLLGLGKTPKRKTAIVGPRKKILSIWRETAAGYDVAVAMQRASLALVRKISQNDGAIPGRCGQDLFIWCESNRRYGARMPKQTRHLKVVDRVPLTEESV